MQRIKSCFLPPWKYQLQEARRFGFSSVWRHLTGDNSPGERATKDLVSLNVNETVWKENKSDRKLWKEVVLVLCCWAEKGGGKPPKLYRKLVQNSSFQYRVRIYMLPFQEGKSDPLRKQNPIPNTGMGKEEAKLVQIILLPRKYWVTGIQRRISLTARLLTETLTAHLWPCALHK